MIEKYWVQLREYLTEVEIFTKVLSVERLVKLIHDKDVYIVTYYVCKDCGNLVLELRMRDLFISLKFNGLLWTLSNIIREVDKTLYEMDYYKYQVRDIENRRLSIERFLKTLTNFKIL